MERRLELRNRCEADSNLGLFGQINNKKKGKNNRMIFFYCLAKEVKAKKNHK